MNAPRPAPLTPEERAVVDEALEDLRAEKGPVDRAPYGCVLALPAFVVLLVLPILGRRFDLSSALTTPVIVGAVVLLVVGVAVWFTAGGFVRGHYAAAAEAAQRSLEEWDPDTDAREEALRGATLLVMNSVASYGPTSTHTFDESGARKRIGPLMPLVEAVERHLVEKGVIHSFFTATDPEATEADGE